MLILGGIAFTLIALVVLAVLASEWSKASERKKALDEGLKHEIEGAMTKKDITTLKRIKLMNQTRIEEIDKGLGDRIDEFVDELSIEADDVAKYGGKKAVTR